MGVAYRFNILSYQAPRDDSTVRMRKFQQRYSSHRVVRVPTMAICEPTIELEAFLPQLQRPASSKLFCCLYSLHSMRTSDFVSVVFLLIEEYLSILYSTTQSRPQRAQQSIYDTGISWREPIFSSTRYRYVQFNFYARRTPTRLMTQLTDECATIETLNLNVDINA
jgi:hypothetical protein